MRHEEAFFTSARPDPSPEAEAVDHVAISEALAVLQYRQRAILILKAVEGWSVAEIASGMGCTTWRVYHELRSAHRALAAWREQHAEEGC